MTATPLPDVINYLQTSGGTSAPPGNYSGQAEIRFFIDASAGGGMTSREITMTRAAFTMWDELIGPRIVEMQNLLDADIIFSYGQLGEETAGTTNDLFFSLTGMKSVTINRLAYPLDTVIELGSQAFKTYMHEIGHALGLSHPGPYNGSFFGDAVYGVDNVYDEDFELFTIMSYFSLLEVEDATGVRPAAFDAYPLSPQLHDVAAIQDIYGADLRTRTGNDVYGFNSTYLNFDLSRTDLTTRSMAFTIWDAGGIDTLDASGARRGEGETIFAGDLLFPDQVINLEQGSFSSIGLSPPARFRTPLVNNVAIAFGTVIENAIGGGGNDTINGNGSNNLLEGRGGNDAITGNDGHDTLRGEDGGDTLTGGPGDDILEGGAGADVLDGGTGFNTASYETANSAIRMNGDQRQGDIAGDVFIAIGAFSLSRFDDVVFGFAGRDVIDGNAGNDELHGLGDADLLRGGAGLDTLFGDDGADTLQGGSDDDSLFGGGGNDLLDGGIGADRMSGGQGDDTYLVTDSGDVVIESSNFIEGPGGVDLVVSSIDYVLPSLVENLSLSGFANLRGTGNAGANVITGNTVANVLDGGLGADHLVGRGGGDTYIVDNAKDIVDESSGNFSDVDTVLSSISFSLANTTVVLGNVERLTLTGSAAINGTGNTLANVLTGNSAGNVLAGNGGNDTLDGGAGADYMVGGTGNDTYIIDNAGDRVDETTGGSLDIDTVSSSVTFSLLNPAQAQGLVENLTLTGRSAINGTGNSLGNAITGNALANTLDGLSGNDSLNGFGGSDRLNGGTGNDTYVFAGTLQGSDIFTDTGGTDTVVINSLSQISSVVRSGNDMIVTMTYGTFRVVNHFTGGNIEFVSDPSRSVVLATGTFGGAASGIIAGTGKGDYLDGGGGDDLLFGGKGKDHLVGGEGGDQLDGGNGKDRLDGGIGDDLLSGGEGKDIFVFAAGYGHDTVTDFSMMNDALEFAGFDANPDVTRTAEGFDFDFGNGDILSLEITQAASPLYARLSARWLDNVLGDLA